MVVTGEELRSHVRVDGRAKVTGKASFAFDVPLSGVLHAAAVTSTIPCGRIVGFDLTEPQRLPDVLRIFTYQELSDSIRPVKHLMAGGYVNSSALPMGSPEVYYAGQIVALVVARSREAAREAASQVVVRYEAKPATGALEHPGAEFAALAAVREGHKDPTLGNASQAFASAEVTVEGTYRTPIQHHNPMELFGTTCAWQNDRLTVYEATRYVDAVQYGLAEQLGIDAAKIRVICPFIGGHFGSRLALSQYTAPVAVAARVLGRPVRFEATRPQCFTVANYRPETKHNVRIAATKDGQFTAFHHDAEFATSRFDKFAMEGTDVTASLYAWRNVETKETLVHVDRNTPGPMRAPPEVPYLFALESAVDEMAARLAIDPIELRRRNDTALDAITGKPFTPRVLMECFDAGAKAFGWTLRHPVPRSTRKGDWLVGYGCATSVRPVKRGAAEMRVTLFDDGRVLVETAHHEIGNGIYTVLSMEAARQLGTKVDSVTVRLGDTALPPAGISGGSSTTTSLVPALTKGCDQLRAQLAKAAIAQYPDLSTLAPGDFTLRDGVLLGSKGSPVKVSDVFASLGKKRLETLAQTAPDGQGEEAFAKLREGRLVLGSPETKSLTWAYGAQFAEVRIHSLTGEIRVARMTGAFSAGRILNRLTALGQLRGGMIWGIGSALLEETVLDSQSTRYINDNLAEYLIATAADTCTIEAILLNADEEDSDLMGLGELGIIGVNAAIANAIFNATGKRLRTLPIRLDSLMETMSS